MQPPKATKRFHESILHQDTLQDPWFWLRDSEDPETMAYLEAENAYTQAVMASTEPLQETLYREMRGRIKEDDSTVPQKEGSYYYYIRFEEGGQYPIYCRKYQSLEAEEEILLDANLLAADQEYLRVGAFENSPDHRWLAYSVDTAGSEQFTIHVKNLETAELLTETIPNTFYSLEWANDNQSFFYNVLDEHHRPVRIFCHRLGEDPVQDRLVYQEKDEGFFVGVGKSQSQRFIYIVTGGNNMSEWYFLDANEPEGALTLVEPRRQNFEYDLVDHGERFLIRHNGDGAKDFKVSEAPIATPSKDHWIDFIPHQPGRPVMGLHAFKDYLVVEQRSQGLPQVRTMRIAGGEGHEVSVDDEVYSLRVVDSREWDSATLRYSYGSMTTPPTVYDYDMGSRDREFKKQVEVLGGFNADDYATRRLLAPAQDGTQVPISLLYRKDTPLDGSAPLYLYGYGSYGIIMEADFGSARMSLVDRGFIFAIAHIRGGMEMGWDWYERGKLLDKKNTFTDFTDCADYLVSEGYTSKGNIAAVGGSAGGTLMGVVANMRPDLFRAIAAHVPFVDVLNTMLDDTLPLTTMEYNEWGNPNQQQFYDYIKSYSPYDNVTAQNYPNMLITGGISDPRVTYWEPAKWTAKLRDMKTDENLVLLKIQMDSGHGGSSGRFDRLKEVALEYAFILKAFGMDQRAGWKDSCTVIPAQAGIQGRLVVNQGPSLGSGFRRSDEGNSPGTSLAFATNPT
ncbi:MAG: S9 family peptidase [Chloroflexi bacterium]|nr:S9 family peptidase [Chloroflexota bacterium]